MIGKLSVIGIDEDAFTISIRSRDRSTRIGIP